LAEGDVLVVTSKLLSRAEGRFVDLSRVEPSPRAARVARTVGKDPRLVELVLRESIAISRQAPGVLIVRHRLGFVVANAGIDASNAVPPDAPAGTGPWALLLPEAPDASAAAIRARAETAAPAGTRVGVVVTDSFGRPFRMGTVGVAIGVSGLPPLWDRRGESDLFGRKLEQTITALADQVAAVGDLVAGQAAEGRPLVLVRETGQRVHHRVHVGRDVEAQVHEVVSGVHNRRERTGRQRAREAVEKPSTSNPTGQGDHLHA
jgi:coenzyme F420-0:L-glutamate ligase/coenzyme F420-1:gamma-L-glutamate ligase